MQPGIILSCRQNKKPSKNAHTSITIAYKTTTKIYCLDASFVSRPFTTGRARERGRLNNMYSCKIPTKYRKFECRYIGVTKDAKEKASTNTTLVDKNIPFGFSGVDDYWETYLWAPTDTTLCLPVIFGTLLQSVSEATCVC